MSIEIPHDLIRQVQIAVLKEANLSSYDPDDASLPGLPSFESSIFELDPSPSHLRCSNCNGRLLRGENSFICVFCGRKQNQEEGNPRPINFKTTSGCSWFLNYLGLDGSEIVGCPVKANEPNRRLKAVEEEFPLSRLLDLGIEWKSEFDNPESESNRSLLNSIGVNLDNSFSEVKPDTNVSSVSKEQSAPKKNNNNSNAHSSFQASNSLSLFENFEPSETTVRSTEEKNGGCSFANWGASFQSAGKETHHEEPESIDPVVGSTPDLPAHMDSVFGTGNSVFSGNDNETINSSASAYDADEDWFQVDRPETKSSDLSGPNLSSKSVDSIQDSKLDSQGNVTPNDESTEKEDDSFGAWNDFTSSATTEDPFSKQPSLFGDSRKVEPAAEDPFSKQPVLFDVKENVKDSGTVELATEDPFSKQPVLFDVKENVKDSGKAEPTTEDPFSNQPVLFEVKENVKDTGKMETETTSSSRSLDLVQDDLLQSNSSKTPDVKTISEDDNSFDVWNDFASSANVKDGKQVETANTFSSSTNLDWFQTDQLEIRRDKATDNKPVNVVDGDLFGGWNDFTSSTTAQDPAQTVQADKSEETQTVKDGGKLDNPNGLTNSLIEDDLWPASMKKDSEIKTGGQANDLFDNWNEFTSSTSAQGSVNKQTADVKDHGITKMNDSSYDWFHADQSQTSNKAADVKSHDTGFDLFDSLKDLQSSSNTEDPCTSVKQTSGKNILETDSNLQDMDFGSFSQGGLTGQNGSKEVHLTKSELPTSERSPIANAKDEEHTGGDVSSAAKSSKSNDAETLISQMHDLSFMLKSELSVPSKK